MWKSHRLGARWIGLTRIMSTTTWGWSGMNDFDFIEFNDCILFIQSEHQHDESPGYFTECQTHESLYCPTLRAYKEETYFNGRGAKQQAQKALRLMMTLSEMVKEE